MLAVLLLDLFWDLVLVMPLTMLQIRVCVIFFLTVALQQALLNPWCLLPPRGTAQLRNLP